jgi:hypothetical protein
VAGAGEWSAAAVAVPGGRGRGDGGVRGEERRRLSEVREIE